MKFGYASANSKDLIQNYSIENGKIIINFLDGSHYDIDLTENNEQTLLNKMLEQAQKRSASGALSQRDLSLSASIFGALILVFEISCYLIDSNDKSSGLCAIFLLTSLTILNRLNKCLSDEIKELKKYDIYLSIRERLEKINDPNIFNGIDNGQTLLNINTLDNYSLKEIKQIRNNLALCEEYYSSFERSDSDPVLVKKISK